MVYFGRGVLLGRRLDRRRVGTSLTGRADRCRRSFRTADARAVEARLSPSCGSPQGWNGALRSICRCDHECAAEGGSPPTARPYCRFHRSGAHLGITDPEHLAAAKLHRERVEKSWNPPGTGGSDCRRRWHWPVLDDRARHPDRPEELLRAATAGTRPGHRSRSGMTVERSCL